MKRFLVQIVFLMLLVLPLLPAEAQQRFPKPEFESGHTQPPTQSPAPRAEWLEYLDLGVLIAAMALMTWLVLKKRSRKGVFWLSLLSIGYFGFFRLGCICPIGAIQNVTLGLFNPGYPVPITVIAFFAIPLIFALFYGRTFCAGVCPLGALQDLVIFRPQKIKPWVGAMLGLIPFVYIGLAVLFAATNTDFIICRYDPFIGFFRLDATFMMFAIGGILLLIGVFIARPYCRFLCPYAVLLNLASRTSKKHLSITPSNCIQCRLCEDSCPVDAIQKPVSVKIRENRDRAVKRSMWISLLIPLLIVAGAWAGSRFHENLASVNPRVRLAKNIMANEKDVSEATELEITAFRSSGQSVESLYEEAAGILDDFNTGGMWLGGFVGLVIGITLLGMSRFYYRTDYTPNRGTCLSCARCVDYCPVDKEAKK